MQSRLPSLFSVAKIIMAAVLFLFATSLATTAQSTNIEYPTPIVSNEVSGVIEARDLGDPRLTRHFYLLNGTPGDLVLSIESNNLNGDVDLFTAGTLRPLTKLSLFAGISKTSTTKSVYLRRPEPLILRVEARSANDDPGTYQIRMSGGFEPITSAAAPPENPEPTVSTPRSRSKRGRSVNAAGARVKDPDPEIVAVVPPTAPPPAPVVVEKKTEPETPVTARTTPSKRTSTRKPRVVTPKPPAGTTTKKPATPATAKKNEQPPKPPAPDTATGTVEPPLNPRLIIETRDGVRVERYMSEVRRMTVERGQLIVVTIDGKIERRPMSTVLRVTIEP